MNTAIAFENLPHIASPTSQEESAVLTKKVNVLGGLIQDFIYYPFYRFYDDKKDCQVCKSLRYEEEYYDRFWAGIKPQDLNLQEADRIRESYVVRDQRVVILSTGNFRISTVCRILQPKEHPGRILKNVLILPGSLSKLNNNLFSFYDFLLAETK